MIAFDYIDSCLHFRLMTAVGFSTVGLKFLSSDFSNDLWNGNGVASQKRA